MKTQLSIGVYMVYSAKRKEKKDKRRRNQHNRRIGKRGNFKHIFAVLEYRENDVNMEIML